MATRVSLQYIIKYIFTHVQLSEWNHRAVGNVYLSHCCLCSLEHRAIEYCTIYIQNNLYLFLYLTTLFYEKVM